MRQVVSWMLAILFALDLAVIAGLLLVFHAPHARSQDRALTPIAVEDVVKRALEQQKQSAEGLVKGLSDKIEAQTLAARKLVTNGKARVDALHPEPAAVPLSGAIDLDALIAQHGQIEAAGHANSPRLMVFVSLSMPKESLLALMRDTARAKGILVLQGLTDGSVQKTMVALQALIGPNGNPGPLGIDPRLFRAFRVTAVPTFVLTDRNFPLCDGLSCVSSAPAHDRIAGNITLDHALRRFGETGEFRDEAGFFLQRLDPSESAQ